MSNTRTAKWPTPANRRPRPVVARVRARRRAGAAQRVLDHGAAAEQAQQAVGGEVGRPRRERPQVVRDAGRLRRARPPEAREQDAELDRARRREGRGGVRLRHRARAQVGGPHARVAREAGDQVGGARRSRRVGRLRRRRHPRRGRQQPDARAAPAGEQPPVGRAEAELDREPAGRVVEAGRRRSAGDADRAHDAAGDHHVGRPRGRRPDAAHGAEEGLAGPRRSERRHRRATRRGRRAAGADGGGHLDAPRLRGLRALRRERRQRTVEALRVGHDAGRVGAEGRRERPARWTRPTRSPHGLLQVARPVVGELQARRRCAASGAERLVHRRHRAGCPQQRAVVGPRAGRRGGQGEHGQERGARSTVAGDHGSILDEDGTVAVPSGQPSI